MDPELERRLIALGVVLGLMLVTWLLGRFVAKRFAGRFSELVGQLVPVLLAAIAVIGVLVVVDPDQADRLSDSAIGSVPKVMIAVIVVIVARALGRIVGLFAETALRGVSASLAGRARLVLSSVILGVGAHHRPSAGGDLHGYHPRPRCGVGLWRGAGDGARCRIGFCAARQTRRRRPSCGPTLRPGGEGASP